MMKVTPSILMQTMDRKEFLIYVGLLLLAVTGISSLVKNVTTLHEPSKKGFGNGSYGK